jgi:hypothetical protein
VGGPLSDAALTLTRMPIRNEREVSRVLATRPGGPDQPLASPVMIGPRKARRFGALIGEAGRLRLVTGHGVEWDVARAQLTEAGTSAEPWPAVDVGIGGERHRLRLCRATRRRDPGGLWRRLDAEHPCFVELAFARPLWSHWLLTGEQRDAREERVRADERAARFLTDEFARGAGHGREVQSAVWPPDGQPARLRLAAGELTLVTAAGPVRGLGAAAGASAVLSGGRYPGMRLRLAGGQELELAFRQPKLSGRGGLPTDGDGLLVLLAPVAGILAWRERRDARRRASMWRQELAART